ncbi:aminotransferase [Umbelopsis sp. AD052]|nr:aminotransferase [Umbelopsis sp. AD052]
MADDARTASKIKFHFQDIAARIIQNIRSEAESEAHQILRSYPGNENPKDASQAAAKIYGISTQSSTGVIYVMDRATERGFTYGNPEWANFGQGAPEVGHIEGCMDKPTEIPVDHASLEYAPTSGIKPLREAVAHLYNDLYRQDKSSQYTWENVCIVPGGRAGLTRVASVIGDIVVGHFLPEYTAYEQMLGIFKRFVPIPTVLEEEAKYHIDPQTIKKEIIGRGLGLIVASNPRNPVGQVIEGEELKEMVEIARTRHTTLVMDEFYSAYIYSHPPEQNGRTVSISEFVDDVNHDPVVIIDGMTKNMRLPGWRVCWVVGPKSVITSLESSGSFLDGGANHPLQKAAIPLIEPSKYRNEAKYLQQHFRAKRDYVLENLREIGFNIKVPPEATFYIWLDVSELPEPINNGLAFFEECLKEKVILVPGIFFDVNPAHRRELFESPCHHFVRLSFGPEQKELEKGLAGIKRVVDKFKK